MWLLLGWAESMWLLLGLAVSKPHSARTRAKVAFAPLGGVKVAFSLIRASY
jgi:hypothetical protein